MPKKKPYKPASGLTKLPNEAVTKYPSPPKAFYESPFGRIWRAIEILASVGEPFVLCERSGKSTLIKPPTFYIKRQSTPPVPQEPTPPFWQDRVKARERVNQILSSLEKAGVSKRAAWAILAPLEHLRPHNIKPALALIESHVKALEAQKKSRRGVQNYIHKFVPPMPNELKEAIQTDCDDAHKLIDRALAKVRRARALVVPLYKQSTKRKPSRKRIPSGQMPRAAAPARDKLRRLLIQSGFNQTEAAMHCRDLLHAWVPELAPASWESVLAGGSKKQ